MYALTVKTRKQLERASLRAQAQKPRIQEVELGIYNVWSTDPRNPGKFYCVAIQPAADGGYEVACGCPTQHYFCKHLASVFPHYLMRENQMKASADNQILSDQEWAQIELKAGTAQMIEDVEAMLEKDRMDIFGY